MMHIISSHLLIYYPQMTNEKQKKTTRKYEYDDTAIEACQLPETWSRIIKLSFSPLSVWSRQLLHKKKPDKRYKSDASYYHD